MSARSRYAAPRPALGALLLAAALAGCGSDDDDGAPAGPTPPYVTPVPVAGCESHSYAVCNVVDPACQTQWDALVGCLRGAPTGMGVPVRVISEADFAAELRQGGGEPHPNLPHWERALTLLELAVPGSFTSDEPSETYVTAVAAYYSFDDKAITVIDHGRPADGISVNVTFAHELVHAAQDRELGLGAYREAYAKSFDSSLSSDALVEGEAELYEVLVTAALNGIDLARVDLPALLAARTELELDWAMAQDSAYLAADLSFPYGPGGQYVYQAFAAGGPEAVRALFASPPSTTRRVLQRDLGGADAAPVDFGAAPLVAGYELMFEDVLGAFGVMLFGRNQGPLAAQALVEPFRSDHLYIYGSPAGTALAWRLSFATPESGNTFMAKARAIVRSQAQVTRDAQGNVLVLKASDDAGLAALVAAFEPPAPVP
ncbi:MAG TPA: hypothetical protein VFS43_46400 [Polyangiaceae bacterium]|nr:hypothetical protein [Polyangiaceae bacterium]